VRKYDFGEVVGDEVVPSSDGGLGLHYYHVAAVAEFGEVAGCGCRGVEGGDDLVSSEIICRRGRGGRDGGLLRLCRRLGGLREVPLLVGVEMVGNWIGLERGGRYLGYSSIPNVRRLDLRR
jgi:hypothetical protein